MPPAPAPWNVYPMRLATLPVMGVTAALFFFAAIQHAGIGFGPFHEPQIIPVAIVETMCGLALLSALSALLRHCGWLGAIIANLVALSEAVLEMVIKTLAGPHTASGQARSFFRAGYVY